MTTHPQPPVELSMYNVPARLGPGPPHHLFPCTSASKEGRVYVFWFADDCMRRIASRCTSSISLLRIMVCLIDSR
jgi:hypothetical protein